MFIRKFFSQRHRMIERLTAFTLLSVLTGAVPRAWADSVPVRHISGSIHGFLELRSNDGRVIASGDITWVATGGRIVSNTVFNFKDGSIDDETTVFSQSGTLRLISDHRIQKGPYFPHPLDTMIDARSGLVTVRATDKDGKVDVKTDRMKLPPDLANGLVPVLLENVNPGATGLTVPMIVFAPKPLMVKLVISKVGEDAVSVAGASRKALHYNVKIDITGLAGILAPLLGKTPPDVQVWTIGGAATTFAREIGPLYAGGPMTTIQLASPTWP